MKVESLDRLKEVCRDGQLKLVVLHAGKAWIPMQMSYTEGDERPWYVYNSIDDSEQEPTDEELMMETTIGTGIVTGNLNQVQWDE